MMERVEFKSVRILNRNVDISRSVGSGVGFTVSDTVKTTTAYDMSQVRSHTIDYSRRWNVRFIVLLFSKAMGLIVPAIVSTLGVLLVIGIVAAIFGVSDVAESHTWRVAGVIFVVLLGFLGFTAATEAQRSEMMHEEAMKAWDEGTNFELIEDEDWPSFKKSLR